MIFRKINLCLLCLFLTVTFVCAEEKKQDQAQESDQQIGDFSLAGYGERGQKNWDLAGKSADIFEQVVKLKDVIGNLYGKEENINLTADRGDFNKTDGKVHLEKNVVVTTTSGTKLTTDALDWDRKSQNVSTEDVVHIVRDNMTTTARGAFGEPGLKKVALKKDVRVDIETVQDSDKEAGAAEKVIITCDGPLDIDYAKNVAVFNNNVKVDRSDSIIYSDKMDVYFLSGPSQEPKASADKEKDKDGQSPGFMGSKIDKIVAKGHVRVIRGENVSYSDEAVYSAKDKTLTLTGRPKLIITSTEDLSNASLGN